MRGVALCAGDAPKPPIKIAARSEVRHGARVVKAVECAEERESGHGAIEEARICLAECVAREYARGLLQAQDDWCELDEGRVRG